MLLFLQQNELCMLSCSVEAVNASKDGVKGTQTKHE